MKIRRLSRRHFGCTCGVSLALPWLEAMEPLGVLVGTPRPAPRRLGVRRGQRRRFERELPLTNLWLSLLARMGVEREPFGDSTGPLSSLDATA
jgi:hypothetical protein